METEARCPVCGQAVGLTGKRRQIKVHQSGGDRCPATGRSPETSTDPVAEAAEPQNTTEAPAPDEDDEVAELNFPELAGRTQPEPLPTPIQNPALLPLDALDPEVLERVAAEIVFRRRDHLTVQFYGRRGQKQYGLDIVERLPTGSTTLYQVKRYPVITPAQIRDAVEEYAVAPRPAKHQLPPRRFAPQRFVIVTSATVDNDTGIVDEIAALQREYHGDLAIVVWGAEALSRELRDAPGLVTAVFGPAWATAFCGVTPATDGPTAPKALGLVEAPVDVLNLASVVADAKLKEATDPASAANLYASVAEQLSAGGFPGHAAVMRRRQADALAASDPTTAFAIVYRLSLDRVLRGSELRLPPGSPLAQAAQVAGGTAPDRWLLLELAGQWAEQGSDDLPGAVQALQRLATAGDPDFGQLACLVLEGALVDGLFEFDPPHSIIVETDDSTPALLTTLRTLAEAAAATADPVLRARLRCAAADARLTAAPSSKDVDQAYGHLLEDALAGRLLHAGGLVASRAARAFALAGDATRAENLWRQAVLMSSEQGLYGDAANALRATRRVIADAGRFPIGDLQLVLEAMPNRRRVLESQEDMSFVAFEAVQSGRLPDAFGYVRRWLWEARLAGHLLEERLAWQLLGDILVAAEHPAVAVECYVRAGSSKKAAETVDALPEMAGTWRWATAAQPLVRGAAVKIASEQSRLVPDADIPDFAARLLSLAEGLWESPWIAGRAEMEAVRGLARLGVRIPASAVDGIRALARTAVEQSTRADAEIANLLVQTYWAVEDRRSDVGADLAEMIRRSDPPDELWTLLRNLPSGWEPLLPVVRERADAGVRDAADTLAAWQGSDAGVQLAARRACAALLRRPVGHVRSGGTVGTSEERTAILMLALLDATQEAPIEPSTLVPALCPPVGGVLFAVGTVAEEGEVPAAPAVPTGDTSPATVDSAAIAAAGSREELLLLVAEQMLAIAEDTLDIAASRRQAILALRRLIDRLPRPVAANAVGRLAEIGDHPGLTQADEWEIEHNNPLSRSRIDTGAGTLPATALIAAAHALRRAGTVAGDFAELASRLIAAALPLLRDVTRARLGAAAVANVAAADPSLAHFATGLVFHSDPGVRAAGASHAPVDESVYRILASDPAVQVRIAVASRGTALPLSVRNTLAADPDIRVRHMVTHAD